MTSKVASICAALAATMLISTPVAARSDGHKGQKQVCKYEKKQGKRIKVCRWVRR